MSRRVASGLETDLQIWANVMNIIPGRNSSEVFRKLCSNERKAVFERVIKEIRPSHEVDHIRKNLALKRMSQKAQQRQMLAAKEEEIHMREHDFELAHQRLKVLNYEMQAIKQRTRDLHTKTLILCYKRQDLEKDAVRYEELCEVANFFQEPKESGCGDVHSSYTKHTENCQNAICECKAQIVELHGLYKMKDLDLEILHGSKKSVLEFVHCQMKDIPIMNIWHALLNSIDCLNKELRSLTERDLKKELEHLQAVKECIDSEMKKFMRSHLELFAAHRNLQHKINANNSECNTLLDRTAEMLQEKMHGHELSEDFQESGKVREWLELQMKFTDLDVIKNALQQEIKNLKANTNPSDHYILPLQEEEVKRISKEIERLQADIRTNYMWLARSHAGQIETEEKLKQEITKLSNIFVLDEHGVTALDGSVKGLQNAMQQELKEFMALPLHLLDNVTLPLGSIIPSSQQILKYHHHHHKYTDRELADVLTALEGAPSATPHSIAFQFLEKKLYLNFLNMAEMNISDLKPSLAVLDISYVKNMDNAATTAVTEAVKVAEKSIEECRVVAARAEDNYRAWLEHPLQHAVPDHLQIDEKRFQEWRCEYDNWLTTLTDLESEEEVPQMI